MDRCFTVAGLHNADLKALHTLLFCFCFVLFLFCFCFVFVLFLFCLLLLVQVVFARYSFTDPRHQRHD